MTCHRRSALYGASIMGDFLLIFNTHISFQLCNRRLTIDICCSPRQHFFEICVCKLRWVIKFMSFNLNVLHFTKKQCATCNAKTWGHHWSMNFLEKGDIAYCFRSWIACMKVLGITTELHHSLLSCRQYYYWCLNIELHVSLIYTITQLNSKAPWNNPRYKSNL